MLQMQKGSFSARGNGGGESVPPLFCFCLAVSQTLHNLPFPSITPPQSGHCLKGGGSGADVGIDGDAGGGRGKLCVHLGHFMDVTPAGLLESSRFPLAPQCGHVMVMAASLVYKIKQSSFLVPAC